MSEDKNELTQRIYLRLIGDENFGPGEVGGRELAKIIKTLEEMIAHVVSHRHPMNSFESVKIGLDSIQNESLGLGFRYHVNPIPEAYRDVGRAISTGNFDKIPHAARQKVQELQRSLQHLQCRAQMGVRLEKGHPFEEFALELVGELEGDTPIPDPDASGVIQGTTTLYGRVLRVGGMSRPQVELKAKQSTRPIRCYLKNQQEAKKIASRLYEEVGIQGTATWNIHDMQIASVEDCTLLNYKSQSATEALSSLSEDFGEYFDAIEDPDEFIAKQRAEDGER